MTRFLTPVNANGAILKENQKMFFQERRMNVIAKSAMVLGCSLLIHSAAFADKFDSCPDPEAARKFVKACMQESPYNTRETCEQRALEKLCSGK